MALAVVVVGVIVADALRSVRVDVSIDGQTQSLDTRAGSVAELLSEMGVTVADADMVEPALDTELAEGVAVTVQYARPVTVVIDGTPTEHMTTMLTVGDALEELGAPIDGAAVSRALGDPLPRDVTTVEVITPKPLSLNLGGEMRDITSTGWTVGDVLTDQGVVLAPTDTVTPPADTVVTPGLAVTVTVVRVENEVRTEAVAHETVEQSDPDLEVGTRKVITAGADGTRDVTYAVTYTNGAITAEEVLASTVTLEPVTEVVTVGAKRPPSPTVDPNSPAASLNWGALAQCESSGNPRAVNPAGYYGLYQFSTSTWASVGGSGNPADATPEEQTSRAQILYERSGAGPWPHCGPRLFN